VLPIGGLKEKLLAAHRGGIKQVLIPADNEKDLVEIPDNIKGKLDIKTVKWIDEVLQYALVRQPTPLPAAAGAAVPAPKAGAVAAKRARRARRGAKIVRPH
jgi:ATP-dependent Lon protease